MELKNTESFLTTGCPKLDLFLRGGLSRKGITQIYGRSGIGKTQLALQLCLTAQIPLVNSNDVGGIINPSIFVNIHFKSNLYNISR